MNQKISQHLNIATLLFLHGIITFAAGIVLIVAPNAIPGVVGINLPQSSYLVPYLLGTAELCIAVISIGGSKLKDRAAIRTIIWSFLVLHGTTALIEIYAYSTGLSSLIWGNVILRVAVVALFAYFGLFKTVSSPENESIQIK